MTQGAEPIGMGERLLDMMQALLVVVLPAVGVWLLRRLALRRKRRAADAELTEALGDSARVNLDVDRWHLDGFLARDRPGELVLDPAMRRDEAAVLLERVEAARRRLWAAMGFPDPTEGLTSAQKQLLAAFSRTLRLRAREMPPEERAALLEEKRLEMRRAAGLPDNEVELFLDQGDDQR